MRNPARILVVDDIADNVEILKTRLESLGYEVVVAVDGEQALAKVKAELPDLVLLDIMMPKIDGLEVVRRIKADPNLKAIPIVAVTSYALSGDEDKAKAAGCDAYIAKPYSPRQMLAKVREILG